ncbi:hypothetical protein EYF80_066091 [Liparis tanakae]|uniref:Uncharacterized protein n=1 Tax=Liparis tanakae TaxID=230148 RepID=A0A4Z2E4V9_9TELE|nr:hypothetical protein EYF80_066091 [Liparis tanakae]
MEIFYRGLTLLPSPPPVLQLVQVSCCLRALSSLPVSQHLFLSGSRTGILKAWRGAICCTIPPPPRASACSRPSLSHSAAERWRTS